MPHPVVSGEPIAVGKAVYTPRENQSQEGRPYLLRVRAACYELLSPLGHARANFKGCQSTCYLPTRGMFRDVAE
eukprot:9486012-Pyramimonas_sp.AAC.1